MPPPISNIQEIVRVQGGQTFAFTDFIEATSDATVFPRGSIQTDDSSTTEFAWVLDTNTGSLVRGRGGQGKRRRCRR